jgi:protein-S-isoprenylcysteine O-methyltransferase Ste14
MSILLAIVWLLFSAYWISSSFSVEKIKLRKINPFFLLKIRYVVLVVVAVQLFINSHEIFLTKFKLSLWLTFLGMLFLICGVSFAIYARYYLGRNWSSEPAIVNGQLLVQHGPYRYIRHPIYLGLILGLIGSSIIGIHLWFLLLIYFGCLYFYKINVEEKLLEKKFQAIYRDYKKNTWALIPYLY